MAVKALACTDDLRPRRLKQLAVSAGHGDSSRSRNGQAGESQPLLTHLPAPVSQCSSCRGRSERLSMNTRVERLERDMVACSAISISDVGLRLRARLS